MMKRAGMLIAVMAIACVGSARACGPFFMDNYLVYRNEAGVLEMPGMSFYAELSNLMKLPPYVPLIKGGGERIDGLQARIDSAQRTMDIDCQDFEVAVKDRPDAAALLTRYKELRLKIFAWSTDFIRKEDETKWDYPRPVLTIAPLDWTADQAFLDKIPPEFSRYLRGAVACYQNENDQALEQFSVLLDLPADQRKYRSVWAAFMLGRTWLKKDPAQAIQYFEQTRDLVKNGFPDPLNLAAESIGWQARAEGESKNFLAAIRHYTEYAKGPVRPDIVQTSFYWVCAKALAEPPVDPALANDPLCRELLTTYLASRPSHKRNNTTPWLDALEKAENKSPVAGADRIAWLCYQLGDMAAAARWVERSDSNAPYAKWVRAKLLLRDGKLDEGAKVLRDVVQFMAALPEIDFVPTGFEDSYTHPTVQRIVSSELGAILLAEQDYVGALEAFMHGGYWPDAAYVAERILSIDELEKFVESHANDQAINCIVYEWTKEVKGYERLRSLLARRMARQGQWDKAAPFYGSALVAVWDDAGKNKGKPASAMAEIALKIAAGLKVANDQNRPGRERAEAYYAVAEKIRAEGMELMGTELAPDWGMVLGEFEITTDQEMRKDVRDSLPATPDEIARRAANAAKPLKRYHYRHIAADLMWQCAQLLPDNDPLMAKALHKGGLYLENRDPKAADRFYKALVRRNPKLAIAQEADRLRWFPKEFTDAPASKVPAKPMHELSLFD